VKRDRDLSPSHAAEDVGSSRSHRTAALRPTLLGVGVAVQRDREAFFHPVPPHACACGVIRSSGPSDFVLAHRPQWYNRSSRNPAAPATPCDRQRGRRRGRRPRTGPLDLNTVPGHRRPRTRSPLLPSRTYSSPCLPERIRKNLPRRTWPEAIHDVRRPLNQLSPYCGVDHQRRVVVEGT